MVVSGLGPVVFECSGFWDFRSFRASGLWVSGKGTTDRASIFRDVGQARIIDKATSAPSFTQLWGSWYVAAARQHHLE